MTESQLVFRGFRKRKEWNMIWWEKTIKGLRLITQDYDMNLKPPKLFVFIADSDSITTTRREIRITQAHRLDKIIEALK